MTRDKLLDRLLAGVSMAGFFSAVVIAVHPIAPTTIGAFRIAARDPTRPLLVALVTGGVYYVRSPWLADRLGQLRAAASRLSWWAVTALALAVFAAANIQGAFVAGGSDSYGYISQADLWLKGDLHIGQPFAAEAPWENARWTFAPLGYRPAADGVSIVPTYSPGLPILMAAAKRVGGQCALFQIVPIGAAVFVLATYLVGRRLGRPLVGLVAASLVATSPTMLFSAMGPMSDVPGAAAWAAAFAGVLGETRLSVFCAGIAAAVAILIRPNLVFLAGLCGAFVLWRDVAAFRSSTPGPVRTPWFVVTLGLGAAAVGLVNQRLYGSPLVSGYGAVDFAWSHVAGNLGTYPLWLAAVESPLALVGLASLFAPWSAVWISRRERNALWLFAACVVAVAAVYLPLNVLETWMYLRYFLPIWPLMMIGTAAVLAALYQGRAWRQVAALGLLFWLLAHGLGEGKRRGVYTVAEDEHHYVAAAKVVARETPPDSVILTIQQSGSLRYYAGRMTMRWDQINRDSSLDRIVDWLGAHGHHPYIFVEAWEAAQFVQQFGPANAVGRLDWTPLVVLEGAGSMTLYDASDRQRSTVAPKRVISEPPNRADRCLLPAQLPTFVWR